MNNPEVGQQVSLGNWLTDYRHGLRQGIVIALSDNLIEVEFPNGKRRTYPRGDLLWT